MNYSIILSPSLPSPSRNLFPLIFTDLFWELSKHRVHIFTKFKYEWAFLAFVVLTLNFIVVRMCDPYAITSLEILRLLLGFTAIFINVSCGLENNMYPINF